MWANSLTNISAKVSIVAGFKAVNSSLCGPLFDALNSLKAIPFETHSFSRTKIELICSGSSTTQIQDIQQYLVTGTNKTELESFGAAFAKAFSNILSNPTAVVNPNTNTTFSPNFENAILNLSNAITQLNSNSDSESE